MAGWTIQKLNRSHERDAFDCGNDALNDWLHKRVSQFEKRDLSRAYVAVREGELRVYGYYALSTHRVRYEALAADQAKGLPHIDVPVVLLGRLAIDRTAQGQGLGSLLLIDALRRAELVATQVGVRAVEVDAIDDAARRFYMKFGFTSLLDDCNHLFLSIRAVRTLELPPLANDS